uniref:Uncharacterized protein n=1 Tax=Setaria italica TaxID=4555 RepID=K3YM23_SETIT
MYSKIPDRRHHLIHSAGNGFIIDGACGAAYHFVTGLHGSAGATRDLKAACSTVLCAVDTALPLARRREDSWNRIAVSATALALLDARWGGTRGAPLSALAGAAAVAAPWGIAWYISEWHSRLVCRRVAWMYYDLPRPTVPEPPKASIEYRKGVSFPTCNNNIVVIIDTNLED